MEWLTDGLLGGIFGVLGGLGTAWLKYLTDKDERAFRLEEAKAKRSHALAMIKAETDASIAEIQAAVQRDKIITEGQSDVAESQTRNIVLQNYDKDSVEDTTLLWMMRNKSKWSGWLTVPVGVVLVVLNGAVDLARKLVRPAVTYGSVGFSFFVLWYSFDILAKLGPTDVTILIKEQMRLISFIASTAVSFWFTDKSMSRKFQDKSMV